MSDASMFYTNRVLKEYRETSPEHVAWTKLLLGALRELQAYIKQHHTTGLTWNAQGSRLEPKHIARPALSPKPNRKSPTPPPRSSVPPPPPSNPPPPPAPTFIPPPPNVGPPPPPPPASAKPGAPSDESTLALFNEINSKGL